MTFFKKVFRFVFSKLFWALLAVLFQLATVLWLMQSFSRLFYAFSVFLVILKLVFVFRIVSSDIAPAYKVTWLTVLLLNTFAGVALYMFFGRTKLRRRSRLMTRYIASLREDRQKNYPDTVPDDPVASRVTGYLRSACRSAAFENDRVTYLSHGTEFFEKLFETVDSARHYVFLDYFIISDGEIWSRFLPILKKKTSQGVDIKLIYDDVGSVLKIDRKFLMKIEDAGVTVRIFNKVSPFMTSRQNNRDHRKVCVADGRAVLIGGVNLSDEYADITRPFLSWKDTGCLIEGGSAELFANEFLSCYYGELGDDFDIPKAETFDVPVFNDGGFSVPYFDCPYESSRVCRDVYSLLIDSAKDSVLITTPYFLPDYTVMNSLKNALGRGVKVKVALPGVYDKWYVRELSRMYAARLLPLGCEIFEYSPGFLHQKMLLVDGTYAVTGSSNADFRSFYLSFESGAFFSSVPAIDDMVRDFASIVEKSSVFSDCDGRIGIPRWLFRRVFAVFAPLA